MSNYNSNIVTEKDPDHVVMKKQIIFSFFKKKRRGGRGLVYKEKEVNLMSINLFSS